ncbi:hypothetical protein SAMN05421786_109100 [Chryseobacterium ureilyticum]|uniref:Uncharacterized protein n=2 Tax=Chryseobacterium ureilyticum TaxID=373668 RepID=A0A1N7QES7_9FLAO|nr:hypothetical protein SAMN05421786_109100 [Chryseobacterium ureilyticum]
MIYGALALTLLTMVVSCKKETQTQSSVSKDTLATVMPKDSTVAPKTDSAATTAVSENIITKNVGKYPHDIKFFEDKNITERLKKLVGSQYDEMVKYFDVTSPISSEHNVYKLTGCKQHDCPGYSTKIYYDSKNDNLNVSIDNNGKISDFNEKGKIAGTEALNE